MIRNLALLSALLAPAAAQSTPCYDFAFVDRWAARMQTRFQLSGLSTSIRRGPALVQRGYYGSFDATTVVPVASATKLISACVLMRMVDAGKLRLDDTTGTYLPSFTGAKGQITIRQLFSHTSGLPGDTRWISNKNLTLAQAVDGIGRFTALRAAPGTEFYYGGTSMSVAGRICEVVSGLDWEDLVQRELGTPLGLTSLDYQGLGATKNYRIAGSARCRLNDYERILEMLLGEGEFRGTRILSRASIRAMFRDQTDNARIVYSPTGDLRRYGIGCWLDRRGANGSVLQISSPGAFGFTPWLDFEKDLAGIVMIESSWRLVRADIEALQADVYRELPYLGTGCYGRGTALCGDRMVLTTSGIPRAGNAGFGFVGRGAPPLASGLLLVAAQPDLRGTPLLGVDLHVASLPLPVLVGVRANLRGEMLLPVPIPPATTGITAYTQLLWAGTQGCGTRFRTGASPGLRLEIL